jgi:Protein of unknown function (DUF2934)
MNDPKPHKQPTPKIVLGPKNSPPKITVMAGTVPLRDKIRERAYELYESRDREPGQDVQDWLRAEQEISKQKR